MDIEPQADVTSEHQLARIRKARRQLADEGPARTRDADGDFERVTLPERDCDALRDLLVADGVERVVEIGLAYGSSALAIGEALVTVGAPHPLHVIVDPFQAEVWSNVGWELLQAAGLDSTAMLMPQPSSAALPQLVAEGLTVDAAFVDGSHRFHEVFLDLYYLRKLVRPGGLAVLDDWWWPSVRTAASYYETNLGWQVAEGAADGGSVGRATWQTRMRALRLPDPPFEPSFERFKPF